MNSDNCARCGCDRVFHRIGTGNGVPVGQAYCDDRYGPPCNCTGFESKPAPGGQLSVSGTFRVHFNRHGAAPHVWCVATDDWEIAVSAVLIAGTNVRSVYRAKSTPDDEDGKPSAWLEVTGLLTIVGSEARIT